MRRRSILFALALLAAVPAAAQPKIKPVEGIETVLPPEGSIKPPTPATTTTPTAAAVPPTPIHAGDSVRGRLEEGDVWHDRRGFDDTYLYEGRAGETLVVTLRSTDFDALVVMGQPMHSGCRPMDADDDGAGGTDSRLEATLSYDGALHIHVRARETGRGAYTLTVERQDSTTHRGMHVQAAGGNAPRGGR
jgi:hypothetical protein